MVHPILWQLALVLAGAKLTAEICERWLKLPAVLAELVLGVCLGAWILRPGSEGMPILQALATLGAVFLLFEVGLHSDLRDLAKVGGIATLVALVGVALSFGFGFGIAHAVGLPVMACLLCAAALTATSVGVTARVLGDLKALDLPEAHVILSAAVLDDVLGLIILSVVTGMGANGFAWSTVSIQVLIALGFLVVSVLIAFKATPWILKVAAGMRTRAALTIAGFVLCLAMASFAEFAGLAAIVGAFAAGLVLHQAESKVQIEPKVRAVADFLVPVFFVMSGAQLSLRTLDVSTPQGKQTLLLAGGLLAATIIAKLMAGFAAPARGLKRFLIGSGMMPRGEVGLIIATFGLQSGLIQPWIYTSILLVVFGTTLITPPILRLQIKPT